MKMAPLLRALETDCQIPPDEPFWLTGVELGFALWQGRYEPYAPLLDAMTELNRQVYPLADYFRR